MQSRGFEGWGPHKSVKEESRIALGQAGLPRSPFSQCRYHSLTSFSVSRMQNAQSWTARFMMPYGGWTLSRRFGWGASRRYALSESPISCHEGFEHVWDERRGIDGFTVGLCVERGVAVEVGFEGGRAGEGQFDALGFR